MIDLLTSTRKVEPRAERFDFFRVENFFHAQVLTRDNFVLGSGLSPKREDAFRIASAEAIERSVARIAFANPLKKKKLMLDQFPSTCGFAAGFDMNATRYRSICEAVERWALSKWIDDCIPLQEFWASPFYNPFESLRFFRGVLEANTPGEKEPRKFTLVCAIGFKGEGAFLGSRVVLEGTATQEAVDHATLESWRALHTSRLPEIEKNELDLIAKRVLFFSRNRDIAEAAIHVSEHVPHWPRADFVMSVPIGGLPAGVFLWRTLCQNYRGWHEGPVDRFVY